MMTSAEVQLIDQWEQQQPEESPLFQSVVGILLRDLPKEHHERDYDEYTRVENSLLEKEGQDALRRARDLGFALATQRLEVTHH